jgi:cytochrome P450
MMEHPGNRPASRSGASSVPAKQPPRAAGLPLLGVLPQLLRDPLRSVARIAYAHRGEVVALPLGPLSVYLLTRPEQITHALNEHWRRYQKGRGGFWKVLRRVLGESLVTVDGDAWVKSRRLLQPLFSARNLEALSEQMTATIAATYDQLEARAASGKPLAIEDEMTVLTQNVVLETIFGASIHRAEAESLGAALLDALVALNQRVFLFFLPERLPLPGELRFRSAITRLNDAMLRFMRKWQSGEQKGDRPRKDLLSLLLNAREGETSEPLPEQRIRDELITLFVAGNETTALAMTWTLYLLDRHPEVLARLRAEIDEVLGTRRPRYEDLKRLTYTKSVLLESLRLYPPAWLLPRLCAEADEIDGYAIPAGAPVLINIFAFHRDPTLWPNPDAFDPDRFKPGVEPPRGAFFPFGGGPRLCIGDQFALMEGQFALAMFLQRFTAHLEPGPPIEPVAMLSLRPGTAVRMRCSPRTAPASAGPAPR